MKALNITFTASTEYRCMSQGLISDVTSVLEYTSHFYLLVSIDQKFRRKFFHQLLHGKLRVRGLSQSLQKLFSGSSRQTSGSSVKVRTRGGDSLTNHNYSRIPFRRGSPQLEMDISWSRKNDLLKWSVPAGFQVWNFKFKIGLYSQLALSNCD